MTVKKDFRLTLVMTLKDREILQRLAELEDISMSQVLRLLLRREAKVRGVTKKSQKPRKVVRRVVLRRVK